MVAGVTKAGKPFVRPATGHRLDAWRKRVAAACAGQEPVAGAVRVTLEFRLQKPRTTKYPDYPRGTPDLDKLTRAALDGLTEGGAFLDDSQVVKIDAEERWAVPGEEPGLLFTVEPR